MSMIAAYADANFALVAVDQRGWAKDENGEDTGFADSPGKLVALHGAGWVAAGGNAALAQHAMLRAQDTPARSLEGVAGILRDAYAEAAPDHLQVNPASSDEVSYVFAVPERDRFRMACVRLPHHPEPVERQWGTIPPAGLSGPAEIQVLHAELGAGIVAARTASDLIRAVARHFAAVAGRTRYVSSTIEVGLLHRARQGNQVSIGMGYISADAGELAATEGDAPLRLARQSWPRLALAEVA